MSVENSLSADEQQAKLHLEFYGFWLWNYRHALYQGYLIEQQCKESQLESICDECDINVTYKYCSLCKFKKLHNKREFLDTIYHPYNFDSIEDCRIQSDDILISTYNCIVNKSTDCNFSKKYHLNPSPVSTKNLEHEERIALFHSKLQNITLTIDFSLPLNMIIYDIERIHEAAYNQHVQLSSIDETLKDGVEATFSYCTLLRVLKQFSDVSFQLNSELRAMGFWLWEQIDYLKKFDSVVSAIDYLRSPCEFPRDLLNRFGMGEDSMRKFNRIHQRTRQCIAEGEVLSLR